MAYRAPVQQTHSFVEEVLTNVDTLPQTLRNVYTQIKDLDVQLQQAETDAERAIGEKLNRLGAGQQEAAQEIHEETRKAHTHCSELGDKKVALAQSSCDIINGVIRSIDEKLVRFELQLRKEGRWPADATAPKSTRVTMTSSEQPPKTPTSRRANVLVHPPQSVRTANTAVVDDVPVDPNE